MSIPAPLQTRPAVSTKGKGKQPLQAKLAIGASNDPLEHEADRIADQVLAAPANPAVSSAPPRIQRFPGQSSGQADTAPVSVDRVLASPGRPLDSALKQDMEQSFGHDFSRVRVHSGGAAEQSAREMNANAYTAGHNIVFGTGQFAPGTHDGRRLIAHELTHVVQQAESHEISTDQSDEKCVLPPSRMTTQSARSDSPQSPRRVEWGTVQGLAGGVGRTLQRQSVRSGDTLQTTASHAASRTSSTETIPTGAAEQKPAETEETDEQKEEKLIRAEYDALDSEVKQSFNPQTFDCYVDLRKLFVAKFPSSKKANEYYKQLVYHNFPSSKSTAAGRFTKVHPNLKAQLDKAGELMKSKTDGEKTWLDVAEEGITKIEGWQIRGNRNANALSEHCFGFAVDINAEENPNIGQKKFPSTLVQGLTGEDVYGGVANSKIGGGGTAAELLPSAKTLREASDKFRNAFESEIALKDALVSYLDTKYKLKLDADQATRLMELLKVKKDSKVKLTEWLQNPTTAAADVGETGTAVKPKTEAGTTTLAISHGQTSAPSALGATTTVAGLAKTDAKAAAGLVKTDAKAAASFLADGYIVFEGTTIKTGKKKGDKIKALSVGTKYTVAAHGFLNLPAEIIVALTGSDGGNLKWLGSVSSGTKDLMHFELKTADQPSLKNTETKSEKLKLAETSTKTKPTTTGNKKPGSK